MHQRHVRPEVMLVKGRRVLGLGVEHHQLDRHGRDVIAAYSSPASSEVQITTRVRSPRNRSRAYSSGSPVAGVGGPLDQHQRRALLHLQRLGLPHAGDDRLERLLRPVRPLAELLVQQLVQRSVQPAARACRGTAGPGTASAPAPSAARRRAGSAAPRAPDLRRASPAPPRPPGWPGSARRPAPGPRPPSRAGAAARRTRPAWSRPDPAWARPRTCRRAGPRSGHQPALDQLAERVAQRHPADPEPGGQVVLGRQPVTRRQLARGDRARPASPRSARARWCRGPGPGWAASGPGCRAARPAARRPSRARRPLIVPCSACMLAVLPRRGAAGGSAGQAALRYRG